MVFTTAVNFIRSRGPDEFWRKRKIFKLAAVRLNFLIYVVSVYSEFLPFFRHLLAEEGTVTA